jgi:hypothetical protein
MPEANAEGTLEKSRIITILDILTKTTSFRSEHQLCEVRTERQNRNFFSNLLLKIGGRKNEKNSEEKFSVLATAER